jgi:hypothetical protein
MYEMRRSYRQKRYYNITTLPNVAWYKNCPPLEEVAVRPEVDRIQVFILSTPAFQAPPPKGDKSNNSFVKTTYATIRSPLSKPVYDVSHLIYHITSIKYKVNVI